MMMMMLWCILYVAEAWGLLATSSLHAVKEALPTTEKGQVVSPLSALRRTLILWENSIRVQQRGVFFTMLLCVRLCLYILYICSTWRREIETLNAWMSLNRQMSLNTDVLYIIIYKYLYLSAQSYEIQQNITSLVTWQDKYLMFSTVLNTHSRY